jgi:predicted metalloprotease with PDZ domain
MYYASVRRRQRSITYNVSFPEAQAHYAEIEMHITGLQQNTLELKMPVWTPGSYLVREFAKNIESLNAETNGKIASHQKSIKTPGKLLQKEFRQ